MDVIHRKGFAACYKGFITESASYVYVYIYIYICMYVYIYIQIFASNPEVSFGLEIDGIPWYMGLESP